MDSARYQSLSLRTVPADLMFWAADCHNPDEARMRLFVNCALGLAGEVAEIHDTPTSDEIGDGYWYSYVMFNVLDATPREPVPADVPDPMRAAYRAAGTICELAKKHMFHGRDFGAVRGKALDALHAYIDALAALDEQAPSQTFDQNVAKLKARYPDGFFGRG